jgi:hypothetical protein
MQRHKNEDFVSYFLGFLVCSWRSVVNYCVLESSLTAKESLFAYAATSISDSYR